MKNKILIVSSDYYKDVSNNLIKGATEELKINNIDFDILYAPGCFEIPFLISKNIKKYKGFIALGCVIRGETYHFNLIANECARKIINISNNSLKPIGFGVLTCKNLKQAINRSHIRKKNKGGEAANACIKLL
jgi:6,7-dimethyl-8-ribityllumazine synthase